MLLKDILIVKLVLDEWDEKHLLIHGFRRDSEFPFYLDLWQNRKGTWEKKEAYYKQPILQLAGDKRESSHNDDWQDFILEVLHHPKVRAHALY